MGNARSRVKSMVTRPVKEYNLLDRAHDVVMRNKPVPSPRHPSTQHLIEQTIQGLPEEVKEELNKTDDQFSKRLQKVYVTSRDVAPVEPLSRDTPERPLPLRQLPFEAPEYGFRTPKVTPYGKTTLAAALKFITEHKEQPEQCSAEQIALAHKLDLQLTEAVLKHFGTFRLVLPEDVTEKDVKLLNNIKTNTSTMLPNTAGMRQVLQGVALGHMPVVEEAPLPVNTIKITGQNETAEGDICLMYPSGYKKKHEMLREYEKPEETETAVSKENRFSKNYPTTDLFKNDTGKRT